MTTFAPSGQPARTKDLSELVFKDDLTDLYNRRYLRRYLADALGKGNAAKPHSLLMLDVDHFKRINDTYGHKCGDQVLVHVANMLRSTFRATDTVVRYAGDEFMVVLPNTPKPLAGNLAERMRKRLQDEPFVYQPNQPPLNISVSVGVASAPGDATSVDELIEKADRALYRSKEKGRGRVSLAGEEVREGLTELDLLRRFPCPTLIGRRELLERLISHLPGRSASAEPSLVEFVVLKGPAGSGKSRLLSEVKDAATKAGLTARMITCGEEDALMPYQCISRILDELLSRDPDTMERVTAGFSDEALYCLKRAIPHLPVPKDVSKMVLTPALHRQVMLRTLSDMVANLAQLRPLVLILDELQHVDLGTLTLAMALRNRRIPNLVFFSAVQPAHLQDAVKRQTPLGVFITIVKEEHFFREVEVPPLTRDETVEMIRAILPGLPASPQLEETIWSVSKGSPLLIQAHLKAFISQGQISVRDGILVLDLTAPPQPPRSVEEAVASTLEVLDKETNELVTDAAVAGPVVEVQLLQAIAGMSEGHVLDLVDKAQRAAILAPVEAEGDRVKFTSEAVREVTYKRADEERRRRTHGQIGQFIEQRSKDNLDAVAAELAHHYGKSDQVEKAAEFQMRCRRLARTVFDPSEATLMATRKLAQPIPPSERPLSPSSAAKILPMVRLLLDAVSAAKTAAGISDSVREKIASLMASLVSILAHDDPLTFLVVGDNVAANGVPLKAEAGDLTAQRLNQIFQSHNIQSLTVKSGVEDREIELLVKAFAHLGDVHVGLLWPVWLGEHEIAHIYVEQQVKTARFIREGEGTAIRFSGMRGEEEPVGLAEQTDVSSAPTSKAIPPSAPASPAPAAPIKPAQTSRSVTAPPDSIASKEQRGAFLQAFEGAIAAGDRDAIQKMVDVVKACLTHASAEVRLGAAAVLEDVLPKCAAHQCEYLTEILVGILCEVMAREEDARVYGRLARIACDAAHDSLRRTDYDTVRRLVGALNRSDIGGISNRGVRAQQDSAINQLLNSVFFELLLDDLTSGEPARVSAATFVLSSFGDKAVPRVVRAIAESESMRARLALVPILKAQGAAAITYIRNEMLTGASALGGGGTTALKRLLTVIGELLPEARDILLSTLAHPSEDVAIDAVHVLSKLPPSECKVELVKLLEQPRAALRLEALRLIGAQKMTDLEGVVTQFLTKKRFRLEEELVREACITLGKLGAVGAVPTLCALLRRRGFLGLFGGVSPSVRAAAAWALGQIGDRSAVPYLKQAAGDRNSIVQGAAKLALQSFKM